MTALQGAFLESLAEDPMAQKRTKIPLRISDFLLLAWECGTGKGYVLGWIVQAPLGSEVPWASFLDGAAGMH